MKSVHVATPSPVVARRRRRRPLDAILAVDGQRPTPYTWLVLGYAALFQIRPWEWVGGMDILPW